MTTELSDPQCKELMCQVINLIQAADNKIDVVRIPGQLDASFAQYALKIEKNMPQKKFPRLHLRLSPEEIKDLRNQGFLNEDFRFKEVLAKGQLDNGVRLSALERLLYAILWKNGDLGKERHLIEGVCDKRTEKGAGIVFNRFGAYLSGKVPYILDQHTLRSYAVYVADDHEISRARKIESINIEDDWHYGLIQGYEKFYSSLDNRTNSDREGFFYAIDRLLFGLGKLIKAKKYKAMPSSS